MSPSKCTHLLSHKLSTYYTKQYSTMVRSYPRQRLCVSGILTCYNFYIVVDGLWKRCPIVYRWVERDWCFCGCEDMKNMWKKLNQLHRVEPRPTRSYVVGRITLQCSNDVKKSVFSSSTDWSFLLLHMWCVITSFTSSSLHNTDFHHPSGTHDSTHVSLLFV